jgi:hypothetical protein
MNTIDSFFLPPLELAILTLTCSVCVVLCFSEDDNGKTKPLTAFIVAYFCSVFTVSFFLHFFKFTEVNNIICSFLAPFLPTSSILLHFFGFTENNTIYAFLASFILPSSVLVIVTLILTTYHIFSNDTDDDLISLTGKFFLYFFGWLAWRFVMSIIFFAWQFVISIILYFFP